MKFKSLLTAGGGIALVTGAYWGWRQYTRITPWPPVMNTLYPANATFIGLDGKTVRMTDFRGKYVVIHYVHPTCAADIGNARNLSQQFEWNAEGQESNDPRVVWLEVLLASEKNAPPRRADLYQWSIRMSPQRSFYFPTLVGISSKLAYAPNARITQELHGFQLLDRQGILRADVTTRQPKHYWPGIVRRLAYWLRTSSDEEPPHVPGIKPDDLSR